MSSIGEIAKFRSSIQTDTINEYTSASGVTVDGVLLKDAEVTASGTNGVITNVIKAQAASGVKFQENGGSEVGSYTDGGAWTLGPSGGMGATDVQQLYLGNNSGQALPTTAAVQGLAIGWNYSGGSGEVDFISTRTTASIGGFNWYSMASNSPSGNKLGGVTYAGAWTLGPTSPGDADIDHTINGRELSLDNKDSSGATQSSINYKIGGVSKFQAGVDNNYGTSGWFWYTTGYVGGITTAGAWTLGPSGSTANNLSVNGVARITRCLEVFGLYTTSEASKGVVDYTTDTMRFLSYSSSATTAGKFSFQGRASDGSPDIEVASCNENGAWTLGPSAGGVTHRLNTNTTTAGANTATLTNAPVSGDPVAWVTININGTDRCIPVWAVS